MHLRAMMLCRKLLSVKNEVQDLLSNLDTSKACGPDDIPACLLKEEAPDPGLPAP